MFIDLNEVQKIVDKDYNIQRVLVALNGVGSGFGITEKELEKKTGLESQELREILHRLQFNGAIEVRCTQIGTAGPYDYFLRLLPRIKVRVSVTVEI